MKYQVLFSLKNNENVFINVVCCSHDWRFKGKSKNKITFNFAFHHNRGLLKESSLLLHEKILFFKYRYRFGSSVQTDSQESCSCFYKCRKRRRRDVFIYPNPKYETGTIPLILSSAFAFAHAYTVISSAIYTSNLNSSFITVISWREAFLSSNNLSRLFSVI